MSKSIDLADHMAHVVTEMRRKAQTGTFNGRMGVMPKIYIDRCRRLDATTNTVLLFTRDTGHHSSGWMKNPDYERCFHLSMSPLPNLARQIIVAPTGTIERGELDKKMAARWVKAFFGEDLRYVWEESPKSSFGKRRDVWHYRVFCDAHWQPFVPRGEVYSTELTELGWRSASQVFEEEGRVIESTVDPT